MGPLEGNYEKRGLWSAHARVQLHRGPFPTGIDGVLLNTRARLLLVSSRRPNTQKPNRRKE
jgi:hypothetical protein